MVYSLIFFDLLLVHFNFKGESLFLVLVVFEIQHSTGMWRFLSKK